MTIEPEDEDAPVMAAFVQSRDRALFDRLFVRHRIRVVQYVRRFVRDPARAEELAQDVFVRVYTTKKYVADRPFRAWLYRVATNVCLNETRKMEHAVKKTKLSECGPDEVRATPSPRLTSSDGS
ncbi:MAG: RNA polymerase sigma factor [Myxococcales bacterium]|nr:RNA polymerase sigma factor [Myxococcales bacterium]